MLLLVACLYAQDRWIEQKSNTLENLRGVSAVSDTVTWASGTHGTYLRTVDGGNTWIAAQVPAAESLDFRDVEGFSSDLAYLLSAGPGEQSRIYKTTNAGKSWVLQMTNHDPMGFLDCMAFWDLDHGIVVGDPVDGKFVLFLTDDGGTHWVQVPASRIPPAFDGEGAFAASGTCIAVQASGDVWFGTGGKAARVFHSSDRGRTWAVNDTPIVHGADSTEIFSILFRDLRHGIVPAATTNIPTREVPTWLRPTMVASRGRCSRSLRSCYVSAAAVNPKNGRDIFVVGSSRIARASGLDQARWLSSEEKDLNALSISPTGILHFSPDRQ